MAYCPAGFVEMSLYKRFPRQAWMQYDLFATKVTVRRPLFPPAVRIMHRRVPAKTLQGVTAETLWPCRSRDWEWSGSRRSALSGAQSLWSLSR